MFPGGFGFRRLITVHAAQVSGGAALADYPLFVRIFLPELASTANGGNVASPGGHDIVFRLPDGTDLDHELDWYNPGNGRMTAWVRVPALSTATDTQLYVYYGNPSITSATEDSGAVWDDDYVAVWHMTEDPGSEATVFDSTSGNNDGIARNMESADNLAAERGRGLRFDGGDEVVRVVSSSLDLTQDITVRAWMRMDGDITGTHQRVYQKGDRSNRTLEFYVEDGNETAGEVNVRLNNDTGGDYLKPTFNIPSFQYGEWYSLTLVIDDDANQVSLLVNGETVRKDAYTGTVTTSQLNHYIGNWDDDGANPRNLNGVVDELAISSTPRSEDWLRTRFRNEDAPATFYLLGDEERP